jgi:hypothetical protein
MNNIKEIYPYCIIAFITLLSNNSFCQVKNWGDSGVIASKKVILLKKIAVNKEIILYNDSELLIKTNHLNIRKYKYFLTDKEFKTIDSCLSLLINNKTTDNALREWIKENVRLNFILDIVSLGKCLVVYNGKTIRYCRLDLFIYKNGSREIRYYFKNKLLFIRPLII